ncbi:MAG TPA: diacylglycerol kinase family protein [Gemmatimonadaceae bacterium]|nr:diacylglycerol kinase family protein [Gemmatimonadaceae bacterium]
MTAPTTPASAAPSSQGGIPAFLNAGGGNADAAREALTGEDFDLRELEPDNLEDELRSAVESGAKRIVVAGGDGTIATAAGVVAGTETELAVLPAGTLNHFSKDHGIPTDLDEAAKVATGTVIEKADLGYVGDAVFLNTSSIGAYVTFVRTRERFEKTFGYKIGSFLALVRLLFSLRTFSIELEVRGVKKSYRTPMVFIGVGERELQVPTLGARKEGGERGLHVMIVQGRKTVRLFAIALAAMAKGTKGAAQLPHFDSFIVDACRIELTRPSATVAVDGELKGMNSPLDYRIERDAINLVVPAPQSAQ